MFNEMPDGIVTEGRCPMSASALRFQFPSLYYRRLPDPNFKGVERHIMFVAVRDVPVDLPLDPNARVPNIRRSVYKEVRQSLMDSDGMFHLKHKGITVIASAVEKKTENVYSVVIKPGEGIVDGGHSYTLVIDPQTHDDLPENQYVKFEILTNIEADWCADIAGGLNKSVQVQNFALDNLAGKFDWLKKLIAKEPYADRIAWRENEDGDLDARDLVSILTCFNIGKFPNAGGSDTQPVLAYEKKSAALKMYEDEAESYQKLKPIAKDIFRLYDTIRSEARNFWNEEGGKFGALAFVECKKSGFLMPFTGEQAEYRLMSGALYPILAAFRWMVEEDPNSGTYRWKGDFQRVIELWEESALELLKMTKQASEDLGYNPNAVGKNRGHWANLFARVAMRELMSSRTGGRVTRRR
jgi:hypothetical protein